MNYSWGRAAIVIWLVVAGAPAVFAANEARPLMIGWATADITPPRPVALVGQLTKRISTGVRDPLTVTALALESPGGEKPEQAILISCDLLFIQRQMQERLQKRVQTELGDFDGTRLLLNATHTHTGPGLADSTFKGLYDVGQDAGVMKASDYGEFFLERAVKAAVEAWRSRKPGAMSWALSQALVSYNRRAHFRNGSTVMYGKTDDPGFENIEGPEDHTVSLVFFWDAKANWTGTILNLACTAQETEHLSEVSADFWHEVRQELHRRHDAGRFLLAQCSPAGDLSPHPIYRQSSEQLMDKRRRLSRREEIARRIVNAVDDVLPLARASQTNRVIFRHAVASLTLPEAGPEAEPFYETDPVSPMELHVLRIGDVGMATSPFELYLDYGIRIQGRSRGVPTLLVQLCGGVSGYLPTERAVQGGGYSADKFRVGPEGGQKLVDETVRHLNNLFP